MLRRYVAKTAHRKPCPHPNTDAPSVHHMHLGFVHMDFAVSVRKSAAFLFTSCIKHGRCRGRRSKQVELPLLSARKLFHVVWVSCHFKYDRGTIRLQKNIHMMMSKHEGNLTLVTLYYGVAKIGKEDFRCAASKYNKFTKHNKNEK
eukprot:4790834-Pleurochrysis_carterae.AAC.2